MWINEEPIRARTLEIVKRLHEHVSNREAKWRLKLNCYVERHEIEMVKVKKKQQATIIGMFALVSLMMNMIVYMMNDRVILRTTMSLMNEPVIEYVFPICLSLISCNV